MIKIYQTIAGGVAAAFLAVPALGQSPMRMSDCSTITPAFQAACKADNDLRTQCNATSNPLQCYNAKKAAASSTTTQQPAAAAKAPTPAPAPAPAAKAPTPAPAPAPAAKAPAPAAKATTPVAAAQPKVNQLPLSCKGGLVNSPTKTFTSRGDFEKNGYGNASSMAATSLDGATEECRRSCALTGEPAPCGWFTLVQWRQDSSATGKSTMGYTCHKVNARNYKDAFKPKMATDQNFGNASNGLFYKDAWTYPCAR